jgi:hypothetical protein
MSDVHQRPSPFDTGRATAPTRRVPIGRIVDLLSVTHAPARVREYRRAMLRGDRFPPISVVRLGGRFVVADGHKRLAAATTLGLAEIAVEVWSPGRLLADLAGQAHRHLRAAGRACVLVFRGRDGRREAARFAAATAAHWRRTLRSLWRLTGPGSTGA